MNVYSRIPRARLLCGEQEVSRVRCRAFWCGERGGSTTFALGKVEGRVTGAAVTPTMAASPIYKIMDQRIQITVRLIENNLRYEITLLEIARHVNLSPSRLRHLFKAETGLSPSRYLKFLRMEKAKELIETTFLTVKEIMFRVGISNQSRFSQDFKNAYSLTPTQCRARTLQHDVVEIVKINHE